MPQKRNIQASETSAQAVGDNSQKKHSIWQNNSRKLWLALALLIAGIVLTCTAALYVKRGVESIARKEFDFACSEIKSRILIRIQQHAQILRSGSAFFKINKDITREQWHNAIAIQSIEQVLPGIQGIGYAIIISPDQLALHERKIRNKGFPQYAVKPTGERDIYTSIIYLEPFSDRNLRAFGYDMFSEPIRRKAMEHARDFDEATLSGKITLVQETDKDIQAGTLMYVPVYERGLPVRTIEERRRAIRGWVYSPYRMNDLMRGILGGWELGEGRQIRLEVFDDTSFQSEALLYDSRPGQKHELTSETMFSEQTSILFNNRRWNLRFTQIGDQTGIVDYSKAWYVLIGGILVSVLLFTLYFLLINANYREQAFAEALTRELRESNDRKRAEEALRESENRFRELFDNMKSCVAVYEAIDDSRDFILRDFNHAAENTEQISKADVVGKSVLQVFPGVKEFGLFEIFQSVWKDGIPRHHPVSQYKDGRIEGWRENYIYKLPSGEVVAIYDDVTENKKREEEIRILAVTDPLTRLYNRRGFMALADQQMKTATRTSKKMSLLFMDIDGMKRINDTWGHEEGDRALVSAVTILKQTFRESDILARLGGDEFAVLAVDAAENPEIVLKRLAEQIGLYNAMPGLLYEISMSIGTTVYDPQIPCSLDDLISRADTRMYEQKKTKSVNTSETGR